MPKTAGWQKVGADSRLEQSPETAPTVAHHGSLELLPFQLLTWQDFEALQWRILRDVEGLRNAQIYGEPGQSQQGLDIVAEAADGTGVALQSKNVTEFGPQDITDAVDKFRNTLRPFDVARFILGVSRQVRTTAAINRFKAMRLELEPVELELWDQRELSLRLKSAPHIVVEYFGNSVAKLFCYPFRIGVTTVPAPDAAAVRAALARTPEVTTGAGDKIAEAEASRAADPARALGLVDEAQAALTKAGFAGHAARFDALRSSLLVDVGAGEQGTRRRLDQLWAALDQGQLAAATVAAHEIRELAARVDQPASRDHASVAEQAIHLYSNPLAHAPALDSVLAGSSTDRARTAVLVAETALADGNRDWMLRHAAQLGTFADDLEGAADAHVLSVRLRILAAEGSGDWVALLADARSMKLGYDLDALVFARNARHMALQQKFTEADAAWNEATGSASLGEHWTDAARWTFSRRAFRGRWNPFTSDELLPVQTSLLARGPDKTVLERDEDALEYAAGRLADDKLRSAAIAAQRALRDAVLLSDWEGERRARRVLADVLTASGEADVAARHLVLAGEAKRAKKLGAERASEFLDVTGYVDAEPYWVAGAAYQLLATQADLVPDSLVNVIADSALGVFEAARSGVLVDLVAFAGSRYLGAIAAVAGIAARLDVERADRMLTYFESLPPVGPDQYRHQDEDEARAVAEVLGTHPSLMERALRHLTALMARSEPARKPNIHEAVTDHMQIARPYLSDLATQGNAWAKDILATDNPTQVDASEIQAARGRLEAELELTPGVVTVGSGSGSLTDAVLVSTLPRREQLAALGQLLERGANPLVSAPDRGSYLLAASNLVPPRDQATRSAMFELALRLVESPPEAAIDATEARFDHPLSAFRITGAQDSRAQAAFAAASLARTVRDKKRVREATLALIGDPTVSEVWATRAVQRLGAVMAPDVGFLSGQNWALRSLAAILWARTLEPRPVGTRLAADPDVRVRRALADALCDQGTSDTTADRDDTDTQAAERTETRDKLLVLLRADVCFSVRVKARC